MLRISVPGKKDLQIQHLLLDLNGTLSLDGKVLPGVQDRLNQLSETVDVFLVTCDTFGNAARIADDLHVGLIRTGEPGPGEAEEKANVARSLGSQVTAAIGNGESDALMLRESALGMAVLGTEGLSVNALLGADVVVPCIGDALDLLLKKKRLIATLRGGPPG